MLNEKKGILMTIFSAGVAAFVCYKIDVPFDNETIKCIFSVILGIVFCALYTIKGLGIIPKMLTGFMVSYTVGLPLFWKFSRWIIPQNYQTLTVWLLMIFSALIYDVFLWIYTEDTIFGGEIDLRDVSFLEISFRPINLLNKKIRNYNLFAKTKSDEKRDFEERKQPEVSDFVWVKKENEKLKEINSTLEYENKYLKDRIESLESERKMQMCSSFADNSMEAIFKDADPKTRKKRFRKLSQIFHPDSEGGDAEIFRMIKDAYEKVENS